MASGTDSPARTLTTIGTEASSASWCSSIADNSSSKCASSTANTVPASAVNASRALAKNAIGSRAAANPTR
ncbi:Uncharacterised protein [Mycobacterium tuberculosis]|nr:Uncharacterised protein [Mycobacterium tuberculosis]